MLPSPATSAASGLLHGREFLQQHITWFIHHAATFPIMNHHKASAQDYAEPMQWCQG